VGRLILHVDLDAFYAAIEQRDHTEWRGLPVVEGAESVRRQERPDGFTSDTRHSRRYRPRLAGMQPQHGQKAGTLCA
jgi:nucleotidyltransferase/DNA polymerase involved in DNA repair